MFYNHRVRFVEYRPLIDSVYEQRVDKKRSKKVGNGRGEEGKEKNGIKIGSILIMGDIVSGRDYGGSRGP